MKEVQIVYDFDGTLTPFPVPFFPILKDCGITDIEFYKKIEELKNKGIVDVYESLFQSLLSIIQESNLEKHDLTKGADKIIFCEGLDDWFDNLDNSSDKSFFHYIVTSGIEEFLYASKISKKMTKIYGTSFVHKNGKLKSIEKLITDKGKIDYIKKINGLHGREENDCTNLIYIGDGLTDYYAMEFVFSNGGTSILVTPPGKTPEKKLFAISHFQCEADYRKGKALFNYIKKV